MHVPLVSNSIKRVQGFKEKSLSKNCFSTFSLYIQELFNMHLSRMPLPKCLPSWLYCEMSQTFILLHGRPRPEDRNSVTTIRIFDQNHFIVSEFDISVKPSVGFARHSEPDIYDRGGVSSSHNRLI
mmetsp:Transcript_36324/g.55783  ORF Transcript_36324/g.55783 Transcript_36324/m.55783 type:complete len:126 (+) Transcript_36324:163-540(+)